MMKSRRAMRRVILTSLFDHLERRFGVDWSRDTFVDGSLSLPQIDARLAYKSDPRIEELRGALGRLERGTFGKCCCCRARIDDELLDRDPARRFCAKCEQRYLQHHTPVSMQPSVVS
jgi:RNA polymerase-binding transcription factor DksA